MATIRKKEGKLGTTYEVQIRIIKPHVYKSFKKHIDAKRWAEKTEMEVREKRYGITSESKKKPFLLPLTVIENMSFRKSRKAGGSTFLIGGRKSSVPMLLKTSPLH